MADAVRWTPGPWRARIAEPEVPEEGGRYEIDALGTDGDPVWAALASVFVHCDGHGEGHANAHLIAAAPALYEALANLIPRFHRCVVAHGTHSEWADEAVAAARAALALARGESEEAPRG